MLGGKDFLFVWSYYPYIDCIGVIANGCVYWALLFESLYEGSYWFGSPFGAPLITALLFRVEIRAPEPNSQIRSHHS